MSDGPLPAMLWLLDPSVPFLLGQCQTCVALCCQFQVIAFSTTEYPLKGL